jgi:hypothetical protein
MATKPITDRAETGRETGEAEALTSSVHSKPGEAVTTKQLECEGLLEYVEFVRWLADFFRKQDLIHEVSFLARWDRLPNTIRPDRFISHLRPIYRSLQALSAVCIRASVMREPVLEELVENAAALEARVRRVMAKDRRQSQ